MVETHSVVALVEDKPGVMQRISGLFRKRNFNIDSITVGHSEKRGISRVTLVVRGDQEILEQAMKQLNKLVEVIKVSELRPEESVARELALIKVAVKSDNARAEIIQFANIFRGRVVDVARNSMVIEITGNTNKLKAFIELMQPYGIKEIARTGTTIMTRGLKAVSVKEV